LYGEVTARVGLSAADAKIVVNQGYHRFLTAHSWSFCCPASTLIVTAASTTTDLADDFADLIEWFAYPSATGRKFRQKVSSRWILDRLAGGSATGYPTEFAIEAKAFTITTGQRWVARWYPTPSADVTLTYRYRIIPAEMSDDAHYPIGGPMHNMTLLYAAMAGYEEREAKVIGPNHDMYQRELAKSIQFDKELTVGTFIGLDEGGEARSQTIATEVGLLTDA